MSLAVLSASDGDGGETWRVLYKGGRGERVVVGNPPARRRRIPQLLGVVSSPASHARVEKDGAVVAVAVSQVDRRDRVREGEEGQPRDGGAAGALVDDGVVSKLAVEIEAPADDPASGKKSARRKVRGGHLHNQVCDGDRERDRREGRNLAGSFAAVGPLRDQGAELRVAVAPPADDLLESRENAGVIRVVRADVDDGSERDGDIRETHHAESCHRRAENRCGPNA